MRLHVALARIFEREGRLLPKGGDPEWMSAKGQYRRALKVEAEQVARIAPDEPRSPDLLVRNADLLARLGEKRAAAESYERAASFWHAQGRELDAEKLRVLANKLRGKPNPVLEP